jgi:hypothetical protein
VRPRLLSGAGPNVGGRWVEGEAAGQLEPGTHKISAGAPSPSNRDVRPSYRAGVIMVYVHQAAASHWPPCRGSPRLRPERTTSNRALGGAPTAQGQA